MEITHVFSFLRRLDTNFYANKLSFAYLLSFFLFFSLPDRRSSLSLSFSRSQNSLSTIRSCSLVFSFLSTIKLTFTRINSYHLAHSMSMIIRNDCPTGLTDRLSLNHFNSYRKTTWVDVFFNHDEKGINAGEEN